MDRLINPAVYLFGAVLFLVSCQVPEQTVTKDYEEFFSDIKEIELTGRFLEVSYEGNENAQEVFLNAYLEAPESSGMDIKYRKSGSKLKIEVVGDLSDTWGFGNIGRKFSGYISLTGPEDMKLNFRNSSGKIDVIHVTHDIIDLKVNSGSISAMGLDVEKINLTASSGSIKAEGLTGTVKCQVNSGSISLKEVEGHVDAKGSSGSLRFEKIQGMVDASVNSGSMRFNQVSDLGELSVSSGNIRAENAGLSDRTSLKSSSGSIRIQTDSDLSAYNFDLSAGSGSVRVGEKRSSKRLEIRNNAEHTVTGRVSSGSIRIEN